MSSRARFPVLTKEQAEKLTAAMIRGKNKPEAAHLRNLLAKMQTNQAHLSLLTLTLEEIQALVAVANREDKAAGHKENNDCLKMLALNVGCFSSGHEVAIVYNQIHKSKAEASGSSISMMVRKKTDALFDLNGKGKSSGRKIFGDEAPLPDISELEEIADEFEMDPSFQQFSELVPAAGHTLLGLQPHTSREASQPSACQRPGRAARPRVAKTSIPSPPSRQMRSHGFEKTSSLKENAKLTKHMLCRGGVISYIGGKMTGAPEPPFVPAGGEVAVSAFMSLAARSLASTAAPAGALAASPARGPLAGSSTLPPRTLPHGLFAELLNSLNGYGPAVTSEQPPQLQLCASSYDTEQLQQLQSQPQQLLQPPTSPFDMAPQQPQYHMVQPTSPYDMEQSQSLLRMPTSPFDMAPRQPRTLSLEDLAGDGAEDLIGSLLTSPAGPGSTSLLHRLVGGLEASLRRVESAADSISEAAHAQAQAQAEVPHPTSNSNATPAPDPAARHLHSPRNVHARYAGDHDRALAERGDHGAHLRARRGAERGDHGAQHGAAGGGRGARLHRGGEDARGRAGVCLGDEQATRTDRCRSGPGSARHDPAGERRDGHGARGDRPPPASRAGPAGRARRAREPRTGHAAEPPRSAVHPCGCRAIRARHADPHARGRDAAGALGAAPSHRRRLGAPRLGASPRERAGAAAAAVRHAEPPRANGQLARRQAPRARRLPAARLALQALPGQWGSAVSARAAQRPVRGARSAPWALLPPPLGSPGRRPPR